MRHIFVINPKAGKGTKQKPFLDSVEQYFSENDGEYEVYTTSGVGDATLYAKQIAESGEEVTIYACGGEGTSFEVLNGVVGYDNVTIGIVPCGSANDFIKYFSEPDAFLDVKQQMEGKTLEIDLIKANGYYAMNSCSAGMDAMVGDNMSRFKKWPLVSGSMAYNLALIYTLFHHIGVMLNITVDGTEYRNQQCLFAVCANAPFYGGGFQPAPTAVPDDGKLNHCIISVVSRLRILSLLKKYRAGEHTLLDFCKYGECSEMTIEAEREIPINMDGEIIHGKKVQFQIVKKGCRIVLPASVAERLEIKSISHKNSVSS